MSLSDLPAPEFFGFVLAAVLAVIALVAWLVRRFGAKRFGGAAGRNRQPRLAVIDAASVDGRRRLVIIRRDNVEHLLIIGGPTDVVVETNIVRGNAAATAREAAPARAALSVGETLPRTRPRAPAAARDFGEQRQQREKMAATASAREYESCAWLRTPDVDRVP